MKEEKVTLVGGQEDFDSEITCFEYDWESTVSIILCITIFVFYLGLLGRWNLSKRAAHF